MASFGTSRWSRRTAAAFTLAILSSHVLAVWAGSHKDEVVSLPRSPARASSVRAPRQSVAQEFCLKHPDLRYYYKFTDEEFRQVVQGDGHYEFEPNYEPETETEADYPQDLFRSADDEAPLQDEEQPAANGPNSPKSFPLRDTSFSSGTTSRSSSFSFSAAPLSGSQSSQSLVYEAAHRLARAGSLASSSEVRRDRLHAVPESTLYRYRESFKMFSMNNEKNSAKANSDDRRSKEDIQYFNRIPERRLQDDSGTQHAQKLPHFTATTPSNNGSTPKNKWPEIPGLVDGPDDKLPVMLRISMDPILASALTKSLPRVLEAHISKVQINNTFNGIAFVPVLRNVTFCLSNIQLDNLRFDISNRTGLYLRDGYLDVHLVIRRLDVKLSYSVKRNSFLKISDSGTISFSVRSGYTTIPLKFYTNRFGGVTAYAPRKGRTKLKDYKVHISHDNSAMDWAYNLAVLVLKKRLRDPLATEFNSLLTTIIPFIFSQVAPHHFPFQTDILGEKYILSAAAVGPIDIRPNGAWIALTILLDDLAKDYVRPIEMGKEDDIDTRDRDKKRVKQRRRRPNAYDFDL